jgi:hypothetical protein
MCHLLNVRTLTMAIQGSITAGICITGDNPYVHIYPPSHIKCLIPETRQTEPNLQFTRAKVSPISVQELRGSS